MLQPFTFHNFHMEHPVCTEHNPKEQSEKHAEAWKLWFSCLETPYTYCLEFLPSIYSQEMFSTSKQTRCVLNDLNLKHSKQGERGAMF